MTSSVERPQAQADIDLRYTPDESILTLGMLIQDANKVGDHELAEIYRDEINRLHNEQLIATRANRSRTREFISGTIDFTKEAGFGAGVLLAIGAVAGSVIAIGNYHNGQDDQKREIATSGATEDGFEVVSYTEHEYANDEPTLSPTENCTVTTNRWDYDRDSGDVHTYTFDIGESTVEVRTAEELIERYGAELCQTEQS